MRFDRFDSMPALEAPVLNLVATWLLAFTDATDSTGSTGGGLVGFFLPLVVLGGLFYFMLILPQRKRMKTVEQMRRAVSVGDEVRTIGGIYGVVKSMTDEEVVLDVGNGITLRVVKRAVAERLNVQG